MWTGDKKHINIGWFVGVDFIRHIFGGYATRHEHFKFKPKIIPTKIY